MGRVSGWRKCDTCRKVRTTEEFEGDAATCQACLTVPVRAKKAAPVTTKRAAPTAPPSRPASDGPRRPLLGAVGAGDLEVRERRAKRAAFEALAESHPEEYALLLRDAREREGLRPAAKESPARSAAAGDQEPQQERPQEA